jgi:hypothetical protein
MKRWPEVAKKGLLKRVGMDVRKARAGGAALISIALAGLAAGPALGSPMITVGSLSSLHAGARVATLHGRVPTRAIRTARTIPLRRHTAPA